MSTEQATRDNKLASLAYNLLLRYHHLGRHRYRGRIWRRVWQFASDKFSCSVCTNIHGRRALVNFGHTYALYARRFPQWNNPLVELVQQSYRLGNAPAMVVDVGAGVGDTALLLESNCPGMVGDYICVEGDAQFFTYLQANLSGIGKAKLFQALLSDSASPIPALVRTHPGSASAQGNTLVDSTTLDDLIRPNDIRKPCVLKIDVDGFDGKVLLGARNILATIQPAVIFEWHPILCRASGNDWRDHFDALTAQGYKRFIWFTKYGNFSHFMYGIDQAAIGQLAEVCLNGQHDDDWHYDVIALTEEHGISDVALAELSFAKRRPSRY